MSKFCPFPKLHQKSDRNQFFEGKKQNCGDKSSAPPKTVMIAVKILFMIMKMKMTMSEKHSHGHLTLGWNWLNLVICNQKISILTMLNTSRCKWTQVNANDKISLVVACFCLCLLSIMYHALNQIFQTLYLTLFLFKSLSKKRKSTMWWFFCLYFFPAVYFKTQMSLPFGNSKD